MSKKIVKMSDARKKSNRIKKIQKSQEPPKALGVSVVEVIKGVERLA
jgi:hypothetical protein